MQIRQFSLAGTGWKRSNIVSSGAQETRSQIATKESGSDVSYGIDAARVRPAKIKPFMYRLWPFVGRLATHCRAKSKSPIRVTALREPGATRKRDNLPPRNPVSLSVFVCAE
jgi:hypothetical protein